jgi:peptidoglycan/xylan/chitin deacetylase (PgdA/CDA1 family)
MLKRIIKKILSKDWVVNYYWQRIPNGVYVFNYHRIGNRNSSLYDRSNFSCSEKALDAQITELKQHFEILNIEELDKLISTEKPFDKRYALITFDDGYIDNYTLAFPILKKHNVSAVFYLTTDYIETKHIAWWDEVAYLIRSAKGQRYTIPGDSKEFFFSPDNIESVIKDFMYYVKRIHTPTITTIIEHLRASFPEHYETLRNNNESLFLNWQQAKEMAKQGMELGSHTQSHTILSQLDDASQKKEIDGSKQIIENMTGVAVHSIAYPVGRRHCYTDQSTEIAMQSRYKFGFNNEPGINRTIENRYDINRICIDSCDIKHLKMNCIF